MPLSPDMATHQRVLTIENVLAEAMISLGFDVNRSAESGGYWELTIPAPGDEADVVQLHTIARELERLL